MMWELIAANRRKSVALFIGMALILCLLGYGIGYTVYPDGGGPLGLIIAATIWLVLAAMAVFGGGSLLLQLSRARPVTPDVHPRLFNVVEEMKIASGLPTMPKVYIIDTAAPNAFATGLRAEDSAIAVTAGLLTKLNRDELQGVVAHEMAHIVNRDVQFMTVAGIMLGSIVLLSQVFLRGMWLAPGSAKRVRPKSSSKVGPQGHVVIVILTVALAVLGPVFARLLYLALSRKREYLADASAVRFTRFPEGLASALEKISSSSVPLDSANQVTAPMYIVNPLAARRDKMSLSSLGSTHPPVQERIAILRRMTMGASLLQYQRAFSKAKGKPMMIIPTSGLKKDEPLKIREAHPDVVKSQTKKGEVRDLMDLMRAVNGFAFLVCACGLKIKVPPDFEEPYISCPRCKRKNEIPTAKVSDAAEAAAVIGAMVGTLANGGSVETTGDVQNMPDGLTGPDAPPLEYRRKSDGWESFHCSCGKFHQISPAFRSHQINCRACGRTIKIDPA